jgi:hypothetical protein
VRSFGWWRSRFIELSAALVIVSAVISLSGEVATRQRELLPADAWLTINEVYVPNFAIGANPEMIYDRVIHENFDGFWIVEAQTATPKGLWMTECSGNGVNEYDPTEVIPDNTVTWDWYSNGTCDLDKPGKYRLKTTYTMTRPGWPQKRIFSLSNVFTVVDRK